MSVYKRICLPDNVDLERILNEKEPDFKYHLDYFKYLIHYIYVKPTYENDIYSNNNHTVNISSKVFRVVPNYKKYLDYMIDNNIIYCDNSYIASNIGLKTKCKGYNFVPSEIIPIPKFDTITKYTLVKNLNKNNVRSLTKSTSHLKDWFELLEIDIEGACYKADELYEKGNEEIELLKPILSSCELNKQLRSLERKRNLSYLKIFQFNDRASRMNCYVDENIGRFHSILTRLKRELRAFVKYEGKELVAIDLKNSQPVLSTLLFNPHFYSSNTQSMNLHKLSKLNYKTSKDIKPKIKVWGELFNEFNTTNTLNSNDTNTFKYNYKKSDSNNYTMCQEYEQTVVPQEIEKYKGLCLKGEIYEDFSESIRLNYKKNYPRDKIKEYFFTGLYCKPTYRGYYVKLFKETYPIITKMFDLIKINDHSLLPRLLQLIESQLFVNIAASRIKAERPDLPIFTLHDSIVTTVGNEDYVKGVIVDVMKSEVGIIPILEYEYWHP